MKNKSGCQDQIYLKSAINDSLYTLIVYQSDHVKKQSVFHLKWGKCLLWTMDIAKYVFRKAVDIVWQFLD